MKHALERDHFDAIEAIERVQAIAASSPPQFIEEAQKPVGELLKLYQKVIPPLVIMVRGPRLAEITRAANYSAGACERAYTRGPQSRESRYAIAQEVEAAFSNSSNVLAPLLMLSEVLNVQVPSAHENVQKILQKAESNAAYLGTIITDAKQREKERDAQYEKREQVLLAKAEHRERERDAQVKKREKERDEKSNKEVNRLLDNLRNASEEAGITAPANFYERQAEKHLGGMVLWLALLALAGGVLLHVLVNGESFLDFVSRQNLSDIQSGNAETLLWGVIAQFAVGKALLFSTLGYALFFSAKNFMAHNHNYVVNQHRHNALRTYGALMDAMQSDKNARDIVLMQAAHCIFAPQNTGYAKDDGGGGDAMRFIPMEAAKEGVESAIKK